MVAELINLNPQHAQCSTALEICAGGKLYNVRFSVHVMILFKGSRKLKLRFYDIGGCGERKCWVSTYRKGKITKARDNNSFEQD